MSSLHYCSPRRVAFALVLVSMWFSTLCWAIPPLAPEPIPGPTSCELSKAAVSYPKDGDTDVPTNVRLVFMFQQSRCFVDNHNASLVGKDGKRVRLKAWRYQTNNGELIFNYQAEDALEPDTTYRLEGDEGKPVLQFTTGKEAWKGELPAYSIQLLLATVRRFPNSRGSSCEISFQLTGTSPVPQAFLHVYLPSGQPNSSKQPLNGLVASVPLGQLPLRSRQFTTQAGRFDDCSEKEACLYVVFDGPNGEWSKPQKACITPKVEVNEAPPPPPKVGCSSLSSHTSSSIPVWCLLLLLVAVRLRRR